MNERIGDEFQQETKYIRSLMQSSSLDRENRPETYKEYPEAARIELPKPMDLGVKPFDVVLASRKSIRDYLDKPISLDELSYLLWASNGIIRRERGFEFRTAPSAGALYPIETYIIANNVSGIERGLYHYAVKDHALEVLKKEDLRMRTARAALMQQMCAECSAVFAWTAVFGRSKWKYHQRAYRYIYLDAGHIAQNLALAAAAVDLGTCQIGALFDDEVNDILGVDGVSESIIYMSAVGVSLEITNRL